ncbi:unnamed protein product [Caretta caretta]
MGLMLLNDRPHLEWFQLFFIQVLFARLASFIKLLQLFGNFVGSRMSTFFNQDVFSLKLLYRGAGATWFRHTSPGYEYVCSKAGDFGAHIDAEAFRNVRPISSLP